MTVTISTFTVVLIIFIISIILENLLCFWFYKNKNNLLSTDIIFLWLIKHAIVITILYNILN